MSWSQRVFSMMGSSTTTMQGALYSTNEEKMSPGLTGKYDWELREKAGMHLPPPPPECMGLEGEYDPNGLAKRVAKALDQNPEVNHVKTLCIIQDGSKISLLGKVSSSRILNQVIALTSQVDGTEEVDVSQVVIEE